MVDNTRKVESLKNRHHNLEMRLFEEQTRPRPNDQTVKVLKIEKLKIKDEIERLLKPNTIH